MKDYYEDDRLIISDEIMSMTDEELNFFIEKKEIEAKKECERLRQEKKLATV